jgi:hypothetical protein
LKVFCGFIAQYKARQLVASPDVTSTNWLPSTASFISMLDSLVSRMDQTPTSLFDSYEQDFRHIISSISDKLEGNGKNLVGGVCCACFGPIPASHNPQLEQRKAALRRVEIELDEADDIVCVFCSVLFKSSQI